MRNSTALCAALLAVPLIVGTPNAAKADVIVLPCVPFPMCLGGGGPGPGPGPGGGSGSPSPQSGHKHVNAGKVAGQMIAYGFAASSAALVVRGGYVSATENREMMYGEAYCTAETFSPFVFKPIRLFGDLLGGNATPLKDIVICPEGKLNAQFSPALHAKVHKLKKKRHAKKRH